MGGEKKKKKKTSRLPTDGNFCLRFRFPEAFLAVFFFFGGKKKKLIDERVLVEEEAFEKMI